MFIIVEVEEEEEEISDEEEHVSAAQLFGRQNTGIEFSYDFI